MKKRIIDQVAGIILAAGASTRIGRPKQLLKIGELFLLDQVLNEVKNSELDQVVLILGSKAKEIMNSLKINPGDTRIKIIENRNWKNGMSSSIISGLLEIKEQYDHCMLILADMPFITSALINRLKNEYLASEFDLGAIRTVQGYSPPAIFHRSLYPDFLGLDGDMGGRKILNRYFDKICFIRPENDHIDMDIDTIDDYLKCKRLLKID